MRRVLGTLHKPDSFLLSGSLRRGEGGTPRTGEHANLLQPQGEEGKGNRVRRQCLGRGRDL